MFHYKYDYISWIRIKSASSFLEFQMCPNCIPSQFLQICNTHGSASIDPIEDIEDLILYTKKRIWSAKDPYTPREIMWVDVGLCHKKLSELQKIYREFITVRQSSKHTVEFWKMFHELVAEFLDIYTEVK